MLSIRDWFRGTFTDRQVIQIDLHARVAVLEELHKFILADNEALKARVKELENDARMVRDGLLSRAGILPSPEKPQGENRELKPLRKTTVPWASQAAKLEADSKERYWKKLIEDRESLESRVARGAPPSPRTTGSKNESEQLAEDIAELEKVN